MRIVRVDDVRLHVTKDARQPPPCGEVDFVPRRERNQVRALTRAAKELALGMRDEQRTMPRLAEPEDGQEDLVLSAAPGAGGVDVDCEHSSQSFANFNPT